MRIIEEDMVDWEPLRMRFIFKDPVADGRREVLVAFIDDWFGEKEKRRLAARGAGTEPQPFVKDYCGANIDGATAVETHAELIPPEWLQELTGAVERSFPDVDHLRLGFPIEGPTVRSGFKWVRVPRGEVMLRGNPVTIGDVDISLHQVSVGQFEQFMRETGYRPTRDRIKGDGALMGWLRINYGRSPKVPAFGVTHHDALAYCEWARMRLPSEAEVYAFFLSTARDGHRHMWGGECWTGDVGPDGTFLACHGPYLAAFERSPPLTENERNYYAPDHYDYSSVSFRVAKTA